MKKIPHIDKILLIFINTLDFQIILNKFKFPDHYNYKIKDLDKLVLDAEESDSILLTTEKDYFRINEDYKKKIKYVKVEMEIERKEDFVNLIKKIYEKN